MPDHYSFTTHRNNIAYHLRARYLKHETVLSRTYCGLVQDKVRHLRLRTKLGSSFDFERKATWQGTKIMNPVAKYVIIGSSLAVNAYVRKDILLESTEKRENERRKMMEQRRLPMYMRMRTAPVAPEVVVPGARPRILQGDLPTGELAVH